MKLREKSRNNHARYDYESVASHTSSSSEDDEDHRLSGTLHDGSSCIKRNGTFVRLLRNERYAFAGYHDLRSAGIESRFTCTKSVEETCDYLEKRATEIAKANPFVFGRLIQRRPRGSVKLWIPSSKSDIAKNQGGFLQTVWVDKD